MERSDDQLADSYAKSFKEPVSTLTHSTAYVAKHFLQWREKQQAKSNSYGASKKEIAKDLFGTGYSVSQVAKELGITYANAHYYKRSLAC
jgi:DNA-binding CsgD family transcriptional regulator